MSPGTRQQLADHVPGFLTWMEFARARSADTVNSYGKDVRTFVAFCEQIGVPYVDQIDFHVVEAFGAVLHGHLKENTIARRYFTLRQFFRYLERHDLDPDTAWLRRQLGTLEPPR